MEYLISRHHWLACEQSDPLSPSTPCIPVPSVLPVNSLTPYPLLPIVDGIPGLFPAWPLFYGILGQPVPLELPYTRPLPPWMPMLAVPALSMLPLPGLPPGLVTPGPPVGGGWVSSLVLPPSRSCSSMSTTCWKTASMTLIWVSEKHAASTPLYSTLCSLSSSATLW